MRPAPARPDWPPERRRRCLLPWLLLPLLRRSRRSHRSNDFSSGFDIGAEARFPVVRRGGAAMKWAIAIILGLWLLCGFIGAHWLGSMTCKNVLRGPITSARAYDENPVSYPGP